MSQPKFSPADIEDLMLTLRRDIERRRVLNSEIKEAGNLEEYKPGTVLKFGVAGNCDSYLSAGWCDPEESFRWTGADTADLRFALAHSPGDLVLSFRAVPLMAAGVDTQEVAITWNGTLVGNWSIHEPGTYHTLVLAHNSESSPKVLLRFHLPCSFTPLSKNLSEDPRKLSLAVSELVISPLLTTNFNGA